MDRKSRGKQHRYRYRIKILELPRETVRGIGSHRGVSIRRYTVYISAGGIEDYRVWPSLESRGGHTWRPQLGSGRPNGAPDADHPPFFPNLHKYPIDPHERTYNERVLSAPCPGPVFSLERSYSRSRGRVSPPCFSIDPLDPPCSPGPQFRPMISTIRGEKVFFLFSGSLSLLLGIFFCLLLFSESVANNESRFDRARVKKVGLLLDYCDCRLSRNGV